jgi:6-phosphofructokinase
MLTQRIGIVTGGGDCPGLNAVIRAVAKASAKRGWEAVGFFGGYEGLVVPRLPPQGQTSDCRMKDVIEADRREQRVLDWA